MILRSILYDLSSRKCPCYCLLGACMQSAELSSAALPVRFRTLGIERRCGEDWRGRTPLDATESADSTPDAPHIPATYLRTSSFMVISIQCPPFRVDSFLEVSRRGSGLTHFSTTVCAPPPTPATSSSSELNPPACHTATFLVRLGFGWLHNVLCIDYRLFSCLD